MLKRKSTLISRTILKALATRNLKDYLLTYLPIFLWVILTKRIQRSTTGDPTWIGLDKGTKHFL